VNQDSFGMALKAVRRRSGLTQPRLADKIVEVGGPMVSQQVISNWERNVNLPADRFTFMVLCKALYESNGLTSVEQINLLLEPAEQGALHRSEIAQWLPQLVQADLIHESEEISALMSSPQEEKKEEEEEQQEEEQQEEQEQEEENTFSASERPQDRSGTVGDWATERHATADSVPARPLAHSNRSPLARPPSIPPNFGGEDAHSPWEERIIHQLFYLQQKIRQHLGAIGAVIIVMWLLGLFWRAREWWHEPLHAWQIILAFWLSNLLLIMLPSLIEQEAEHYPVVQLKLSRLSGAGSGLTIIAGFLLWMEALWHVIFESPLALWLLYPLIILGVASAYTAGVNVQFWFYQQRDSYESAYLRNTIMISISSFAAQALLVWSCYFLYTQLPDMLWHVLMLAPAVLMILVALRR